MKRKIARKIGFCISMIIWCCFITGCSNKNDSVKKISHENEAEEKQVANEDSGLSIEEESTSPTPQGEEPASEEDMITIACGELEDSFSPFQRMSSGNQTVMRQIQIMLLDQDRGGQPLTNAKDGEEILYCGRNYTYHGLSNLDIDYDEQLNQTTYRIELREDVKFSDGVLLTADDVIFTLYALCDPSYEGEYTLRDSSILGLNSYVEDNSMSDTITEEQIDEALLDPTEHLQQTIIEDAMIPLLTSELEICRTFASDSRYDSLTKGITKAKDILASLYSRDPEYDSTRVSESQVILDLADQYGYNYKSLASAYGEEDYFDDFVRKAAREELLATLREKGAESVDTIDGIQKTGEYSVSVITRGYDPKFVECLMIPVYPMHYYGDEAQYDYEKQCYGFEKGNLPLSEERALKPMGAGPYRLDKAQEDQVVLTANDDYYLGSPKTSKVCFQYLDESERIIAVSNATVDLADITGSRARFDEIKNYNENHSIQGETIVTQFMPAAGYGYIGMNPDQVCIAEDPESEASKDLRTALAVILGVYRDSAIEAYYSDSACVIQLPMSLDSWYTPVVEHDFVCFGINQYGNEIYSNEMSEKEKQDAAIKTARGYLKQAGYQYDESEGKFIEAPEGGKLRFDLYFNGSGIGDHPCYGILTLAKKTLDALGIALVVHDVKDSNMLWEAIEEEKADLWCAAWQSASEPEFVLKYLAGEEEEGSKKNHYEIRNDSLTELAVLAELSTDYSKRKEYYQQCYQMLLEEAVELPVYQRYDATIYQAGRLEDNSITENYTHAWNWENELFRYELKK